MLPYAGDIAVECLPLFRDNTFRGKVFVDVQPYLPYESSRIEYESTSINYDTIIPYAIIIPYIALQIASLFFRPLPILDLPHQPTSPYHFAGLRVASMHHSLYVISFNVSSTHCSHGYSGHGGDRVGHCSSGG